MKCILSIVFFCLAVSTFAQEGEEAMITNPSLHSKEKPTLKASPNTFDSTFIYSVDTLTLPFFDEFSKNNIQTYDADFGDPGVTSELWFRLLDQSNVPLANDVSYTIQETYRKTFDTGTGESTIEPFTPISIQVGDLSSYPVVYATTDVYPPYYIFDTVGIADEPDTVFIVSPSIYQDSARQFFAHVTDQSKLWQDDYAYHNYRFPVNPWSLGVMTFDGLDETGFPYAIGTNLTNYADYLTSKPINMSTVVPSDSVYLSFLVQKEGYGNAPEVDDSLVLEFYNTTTQEWMWAWSTNGGGLTAFELGHVKIEDPIYFSDAFQFRFKNYGGLSGSLDHFHLDYVNLRDFSGYQDTLIEDFAMSYPVYTLLKDYTQVPWDHYKNNPAGKMATEVPVVVRNSYLNGGANISSAGGGEIRIDYNGVNEGNVVLNGQVLANYNPPTQPIPDYQPRTTYESVHDVSTYSFDNTKPGEQVFFDVRTIVSVPVGSNFLQNDTAYSQQAFRNYYAYDDGSAERAYGPQGQQARLAIQYTPYEADSIIGMMVHFVPTVEDVTDKLFQITIWDDNNGIPGDTLYQDNPFYARQPMYETTHNKFVTYYLANDRKVAVDGTFYIGWKQIDPERLGVGIDKNIDNKQHTFFSLDNEATWTGSSIPGSVMIRPIFSTSLDDQLNVESMEEEVDINVYPNPASTSISVVGRQDLGMKYIYSMNGELVLTSTENRMDISSLKAGMYLMKVENAPAKTFKIIKVD